MAKLLPIPAWAAPSLQGLAYWLGSQHAMRLAANLSEGAIAWELSRLIFTHRTDEQFLEAEVQYRHIPELNAKKQLAHSRERADLVVSNAPRSDQGVSYRRGQVDAIIEIKHNRSRKQLVWADIDYLGEQRTSSKGIRAFLIYTSVNMKPDIFTDEIGAAKKSKNLQTPTHLQTSYRVRRVCRATHLIPGRNKTAIGHYAVLIEVSP